jgi:hypothetical protein
VLGAADPVGYWLMLQVKGKVAVRPWSAFVATPESSWSVTTYVAEAPAARTVNGTALNVVLARVDRL